MNSNWKKRYTEKQLEKKRLADRLSQQRLRKESKRAAAELEERLQLSLRGDYATLVRRLLDENAELRSTVNHYHSRFEDIINCSQDCLEYEGQPKETGFSARSAPEAGHCEIILNTMSLSVKSFPPIPGHTSIYFNAETLLMTSNSSPISNPSVSISKILESVTAWKLCNNHGLGPHFLVELFALNQYPEFHGTPDQLYWRIPSNRFYHHLLEGLTVDTPLPTREEDESYRLPQGGLSEMERQKRTVALYTFEIIRKLKPFFVSYDESSAVFWALFKYFQFLTFPTLEALKETPCWLWPTPTQFSRAHPGFIDFLIWPQLRDAIIFRLNQYNKETLLSDILRNFELEKTENASKEPMLILTRDSSDIILNPAMREVVYSLRSFRMREAFGRNYPELAICVATDRNGGSFDDSHIWPTSGGYFPVDAVVQSSFINTSGHKQWESRHRFDHSNLGETVFSEPNRCFMGSSSSDLEFQVPANALFTHEEANNQDLEPATTPQDGGIALDTCNHAEYDYFNSSTTQIRPDQVGFCPDGLWELSAGANITIGGSGEEYSLSNIG